MAFETYAHQPPACQTEEQEFEVGWIVAVRASPEDRFGLEWLVKWKGYGHRDNTIQSTESMLYCEQWRNFCRSHDIPWAMFEEFYDRGLQMGRGWHGRILQDIVKRRMQDYQEGQKKIASETGLQPYWPDDEC